MTHEAYPLHWPAGRPRTPAYRRERAKFEVTFARARDNIVREVQLLVGGRFASDPHVVISTNTALRRDGLPLANQRQPDDVGVAVYFMHKKRQMSFACDRWNRIEHNMQAIAKTIEALRGIARWGTGDMLEAAFTGFVALPAPAAGASSTWWEVLGVTPGASIDAARDAYRRLAGLHHPDRGGDAATMARLNAAWAAAQREASR